MTNWLQNRHPGARNGTMRDNDLDSYLEIVAD